MSGHKTYNLEVRVIQGFFTARCCKADTQGLFMEAIVLFGFNLIGINMGSSCFNAVFVLHRQIFSIMFEDRLSLSV